MRELLANRYRLRRRIADGGMGTVYEAYDVARDFRCAIKVLNPEYASHPRAVRRFLRESDIMGLLANDHIVPIVDSGTHAGVPFLVMEFLEGQDLGKLLLEHRRLPVQRALKLALEACRGLRAVHAAGLVHRDLKPSNIFVARNREGGETAKILDFGVAKLRGEAGGTGEGALIGTAAYMAPEQIICGRDVDGRADIYSLGAVLYESLSGARLYQGDRNNVLYSILGDDPVPLQGLCPELPLGLAEVITRALARATVDRYLNVEQFSAALLPFAAAFRESSLGGQ